ncbi:MAG: polyribonucleotide nucleotidyltransferase [Nitrospinota bacterium]
MEPIRVELKINNKLFYMETGLLARQASGSVVVGYEETIILVAVAAESSPRNSNSDFLPLTVEYRDKTAAAGRIPGGFLKREGRPSDSETLISRMVDRSVRPIFHSGFLAETQIVIHPLSFDYQHETDTLAINGASAGLLISELPFEKAIGAVKIGRVDGELIVNPTIEQLESSDLNLIVAGTEESLTMVEGAADNITEQDLIAALSFGHEWVKKIVSLQLELASKTSKKKIEVTSEDYSEQIAMIEPLASPLIKDAVLTEGKHARSGKIKEVRNGVIEKLLDTQEDPDAETKLKRAFDIYQKNFIRNMILEDGVRVDNRKTNEVRDIQTVVDALPRTHGSALFTRGETQALVTTTLGGAKDELMVDNLAGRSSRHFMLHYNFPSFCVNEVKRMTGPGRREIGHGALAERAVEAILPSKEEFPYTIRVVSEVLESNGSSSMATVCGASLSLMDAGVPVKDSVAGIAMGLIQDGDRIAILSDILGLEDAIGDMDFKVAGTKNGITAVQMDIKLEEGLTVSLLEKALEQAKEGRLHILAKMGEECSGARTELNKNAPRIETLRINPDKIGTLIGPGGKVIKGIVEETGCQIDIEDSGVVNIFAKNNEELAKALETIKSIIEEAEVGRVYMGNVKRVVDFGAFIEILPGTDGLCHISELSEGRTERVEDVVEIGDDVLVKVISVDHSGKIRLSLKEAINQAEGSVSPPLPRESRPDRDSSSRRPHRTDSDRRGGGGDSRDGGDRNRGGRSRNRSDRSDRGDRGDRGRNRY